MALEPLLHRIRGEYREMPGLRLTLPQACRLWQIDPATCARAIETLTAERFLHRLDDGAYVAWPTGRARLAQATLPRPTEITRPRSA